jgi:hypothetical protein
MTVKLDLAPLEHLMAQVPKIADAACEHAAQDVLARLKAREPRRSGALQESLGIKTGSLAGYSYAAIGPEADVTGDDPHSQGRPEQYQASVDAEQGHFMRTLLGPGDVDALAEGATAAIERVLHGGRATD